MKRSLLFAFVIVCISSASSAQAEYIGGWRWIGLGWGPGYHSGVARHHGHALHGHQHYGQYQFGPQMGPAWETHPPVAPANAQPELAPVPEAITPMPAACAWRGELSPAQQAVLQRESQRRSALAPDNSAAPSFKSYFESGR